MSKSTKKKEWTPARLHAFIVATLRSGMRRWPPKWEALKGSFVGKKVNTKTKRLGNHYACAECGGEFSSTQVQVDHIEPAVDPVEGFISWDRFIERLYVDVTGLQVLCKPCHKEKSNQERKIRQAVR